MYGNGAAIGLALTSDFLKLIHRVLLLERSESLEAEDGLIMRRAAASRSVISLILTIVTAVTGSAS